jgi:PPOX class probable F420-dependent enzyme
MVFVGRWNLPDLLPAGPAEAAQHQQEPAGWLNLNSNTRGGDVVRVEGTTEIVEDAPPATEVGEYVEKYRAAIARIGFDPNGFARAYSVALRVTPTRWQVW